MPDSKAPYLFDACPQCGGGLSYSASFDDDGFPNGSICECEVCEAVYEHDSQIELMDKIASLNESKSPISIDDDDLPLMLCGAIG